MVLSVMSLQNRAVFCAMSLFMLGKPSHQSQAEAVGDDNPSSVQSCNLLYNLNSLSKRDLGNLPPNMVSCE